MAVRSTVEALLRDRKLDRTLTSHAPSPQEGDEEASAAIDVEAIDRALSGGLPRGQVSEVVGPVSSGRTSLVWAALGAATRRGELVALIDTFDRFDVATGISCGIECSRLLWVRGTAISKTAVAIDPDWLPGMRSTSGPGTLVERTIDRALKALNLVVQSGVCTLVALDLVDVPAAALRRLPASTWLRVQRIIEGSETAVVLIGSMPIARSVGGRSIKMGRAPEERGSGPFPATAATNVLWQGGHDRSRRLAGVRTAMRVGAARWPHTEQVEIDTSTLAVG